MKIIEIWFSDLDADKKKEVLDAYGLKSAEDDNFDLSPLAILEVEK